MVIVLENEDQVKLKYQTTAIIVLRSSGKSTYTWLRFINGTMKHFEFIFKAFVAYWLSWCMQSNELEDGLNPYFSSLAILITKGIKLALASLYLDSLYVRLDKCARNMIAQLAILEGRGGGG